MKKFQPLNGIDHFVLHNRFGFTIHFDYSCSIGCPKWLSTYIQWSPSLCCPVQIYKLEKRYMTPTTYSYAYHNHENDDNDEWENTKKTTNEQERNAERDSANEEFVYWPLLFLLSFIICFTSYSSTTSQALYLSPHFTLILTTSSLGERRN